MNYAESIKRCVCIIYDPQTSARGTLTLKAITLKENFIKVSALYSSAPEGALMILLHTLCTQSLYEVSRSVQLRCEACLDTEKRKIPSS